MRTSPLRFAILAILLLLSACGEEPTAALPPPQALTRAAIGHYCNMIVADHSGPKGQIFLLGAAEPIWFSSVRDTIAFTLLPEEAKNIAAIYVNDVSPVGWAAAESGPWIEAKGAWYVIGSDRRGGMGAPEAVPFSERAAAEAFAAVHGGDVVAFAAIPADAILGAVPEMAQPDGQGHGEGVMSHSAHDAHGPSTDPQPSDRQTTQETLQ